MPGTDIAYAATRFGNEGDVGACVKNHAAAARAILGTQVRSIFGTHARVLF